MQEAGGALALCEGSGGVGSNMAERGYSFSLTTFRYSGGEGCGSGLLAGRLAGEREDGAQPARSGPPAAGQDGVGSLQSHRVRGAGPARAASGGGWTPAGVGKALVFRRFCVRRSGCTAAVS